MVSTKIKRSQIIIIIIAGLVAAAAAFLTIYTTNHRQKTVESSSIAQPVNATSSDNASADSATSPEISLIDLQPTVDAWSSRQPGTVAVQVYDLDNNVITATHNATRSFSIESIYKLFVVYVGYLRLEQGVWTDEPNYLTVDDTTYSRTSCLDAMIRASNSDCGEKMLNEIGAAALQQFYQQQGITNTSFLGFTSTAEDIVKLLTLIYHHARLSDTYYNQLMDSMLNQPVTPDPYCDNNQCDWRQGFPSGFANATVYNKVGWYGDGHWRRYNDAAIVVFDQSAANSTSAQPGAIIGVNKNSNAPARHLAVAVLTEDTDPYQIKSLGAQLEEAVLAAN